MLNSLCYTALQFQVNTPQSRAPWRISSELYCLDGHIKHVEMSRLISDLCDNLAKHPSYVHASRTSRWLPGYSTKYLSHCRKTFFFSQQSVEYIHLFIATGSHWVKHIGSHFKTLLVTNMMLRAAEQSGAEYSPHCFWACRAHQSTKLKARHWGTIRLGPKFTTTLLWA